MKLRIFKAVDGDALLLTGRDGKNVLIDAGRPEAWQAHVSRIVSRLERLDVLCVSHLDRDHIGGVLSMLDAEVAWRVHDWHIENGNAGHGKPATRRPPPIEEVWHNAFFDDVGENAGDIADMLAAQSRILSGHASAAYREVGQELGELATSVADALEVSWRLATEQLDIPVNSAYGHGFMYHASPTEALEVGGMSFTVIGPYLEELENLRKEWNAYLKKMADYIAGLREGHERDEEWFGGNDLGTVMRSLVAEANALGEVDAIREAAEAVASASSSARIGNRKKVTTPNLASLMFHVEEDGKTVLLTGDGHAKDVEDGLEDAGLLQPGEGLHVNVLKVAHHGSEFNTTESFCRRVTADHYVFCSNGNHDNPDPRVVKAYLQSRVGSAEQRSDNPEASRRFKMWFNYDPDDERKLLDRDGLTESNEKKIKKRVKVLQEVKDMVLAADARYPEVRYRFMRGAHSASISL